MQATLATPPAPVVSMMRGILMAYAVIVCAYFPVGIAGYAAFGNAVDADVLLTVSNPQWLIRIANLMVVVHVGASWQVRSTCQNVAAGQGLLCISGKDDGVR